MSEKVRTALVTGANRGLGLETVKQLARRGFQVILASRDEEKGRAVVEKLKKTEGLTVLLETLDVADPKSIAALAGRLSAKKATIDILVNNAAVALDGFNGEVARKTIDSNFYGPIRVTDALLGTIPNGGTIVMVSSGAGELSILSNELRARFVERSLTRAGLFALIEQFMDDVVGGRHEKAGWPTSAYGVSKAGLNAFVRIAAPLLKERDVRINSVCPGWVRTDMGGPHASRSIDVGGASIVWAATLANSTSGGFFRDGKAIPW